MYQGPFGPAGRATDVLARRVSLGLDLRATPEGLEIVRVTPGGTASGSGVSAGAHLVEINGEAVDAPSRVAEIAKQLAPGSRVSIGVASEGGRRMFDGVASCAPLEAVRGAEVELGHVHVRGHRLRTLHTAPLHVPTPHVTVLVMSGLGAGSVELAAAPRDARRRLIEDLSACGFATMRVERSGVGDSEGPPCRETDLFAEVDAYRAALLALRDDHDTARVIVFAPSVGGMIAPLLDGAGVDGIVAFGTSSARWVECLVSSTRRQRLLAGDAREDVDAYVARWAEMHERVCREGLTPAEVFARHTHLASLEGHAARGRTMFGRDVAFFQQLERLDLRALWRTVSAAVLVLHGELDWVCAPEEGRDIADRARQDDGARGPAQFALLEATGHDMMRHASLAASFSSPRDGEWDGSVVRAVSRWARDVGLSRARA